MDWIIVGAILWLGIGFLGRCIVKHQFIARFSTNGLLSKGETWDGACEVAGVFTIVVGLAGLIGVLLFMLTCNTREERYWGLMI
ncbi:hypothetical protein LCGC14_1437040 [marine sediment metagenome]|uniref:Uncharacterized protein n=1 Tax=marine sediment metagenome TaxID=412755 RepID=A0A0F9JLY9_9ZZZZ